MYPQLLQEKKKVQQQKQVDLKAKKEEESKKKIASSECAILDKKIEEITCIKRILETIISRQIEKRTDYTYDLKDRTKPRELEVSLRESTSFQKAPELLTDEANTILNVNKIHNTKKLLDDISTQKEQFKAEFEKGIKIRKEIIENFKNMQIICSSAKNRK